MRDIRYLRNGIFDDDEQEMLKAKKVAVIGCGGLGGYVIEMLARLGIGHLVICDGDAFDETNLNRQILSMESNIGSNKALEAAKRVLEINSLVRMTVHDEKLTVRNGRSIIEGCDVVIDALDTPRDKVLLEELCEELRIPLVHGAISGWFGQVTVVFPGEQTLHRFYSELAESVEEDFAETKATTNNSDPYGNPSFTPALVAAIQVSEAIKVLLGRGDVMSQKMTLIDLYFNEIKTAEV